MNDNLRQQIEQFRHAVPYINAHRGKIFVISLEGEALVQTNFHNIINDIGLLHSLNIKLVIVYGARPQIEADLKKNGINAVHHKQLRVTNTLTFTRIKQIIGMLQLDITAQLSMSLNNTPSQGAHINVVSGNFVIAQPLGIDEGIDYGHSGQIRRINTDAIHRQLEQHAIVLIGPIAVSVTGENFLISAEDTAAQLAIKLHAEKLIGFCSLSGLYNEDHKIITELFPHDVETYCQNHSMTEHSYININQFLQSAIKASRAGVRRCHLISYNDNGALLQELFSRQGIGTQIVMENTEQIRSATINDIGGIVALIRPLEQQGSLVKRSRKQLEMEIDKFTVIELDNMIISCAALYPFPEEAMGEMACVAVHPNYRNASRGEILLKHIIQQAKHMGLTKLFVLTTLSIHWFQERGFIPVEIDALPLKKKELYNYQRKAKILCMSL